MDTRQMPQIETWHIEFENGCCSAVYDTIEQVKAALAEHLSISAQMGRSRHHTPVRLVSSEGQKIAIPATI